MKGYFFTFEGIDGCGKSTQLSRTAGALRARGANILVTREPGGPPISEKIREILISPDNSAMFPETECLLYLAARAQHVREVIKPAVERGQIVLCDRFEQATFAYQGYGRGLEVPFLKDINSFAAGGISPDITFIFDIPVELSQERLSRIGKGKDRMESEGAAFFGRVREGYLNAARLSPGKIRLLDGSKGLDELTGEILGIIEARIAGQDAGQYE
ncbi:MAG: dTMP kinase [Chitinispirillia bacterium]|nr:dTMP kinase [Chitinispirillia bacterium]MCL2268790.1 dTMP kinase [Chitinispirillia bacterium]